MVKGWKRKDDSDGLIRFKLKGEPQYYSDVSKSHDIIVYPIIINEKRKGWDVYSRMFGDKYFKTKPKAIKFAKSYMRKHPNG